jgi:hypothetical protein
LDRIHDELRAVLPVRIRELGLKVEGSPVEPYVQQLYRELERKKLQHFRPVCYLSDEWGCPSGQPVIGVPFYLADQRLARLEAEVNDLESPREIMMYLRHEAGHAFNYAYELYKTPEWNEMFGSYRRAYRDDYRPVPFSRRYVRYLPGWYAQKHPDEDFAETFAVWLTPRLNWRKTYAGWEALEKLQYMDRIARGCRKMQPVRKRGFTDITVDEMDFTVAEFYERALQAQPRPSEMPHSAELAEIFRTQRHRGNHTRSASELVREHRRTLVDTIAHWTGVQRPVVKTFVEAIEQNAAQLQVEADAQQEARCLVKLAAYATAHAFSELNRRSAPRRAQRTQSQTHCGPRRWPRGTEVG